MNKNYNHNGNDKDRGIQNLKASKIFKKKLGKEDFQKVKGGSLGKGSYGQVYLVKEITTKKLFAMKVMSKKFIVQYSTTKNLRNEIKIQRRLKHPHIARLYHYFEDTDNVYLIIEYAENGNLYHYLKKKKKLKEDSAFIFFFQTCLGMDYIQKRGIIHRDLKPENLLLDSGGNIKLCDFGWSAQANQKARTTFCGTIEYMAPEMLRNKPYTSLLDNWCLGVLLFELLHGYPPFDGRSEGEKIAKIKKGKISKFQYGISKEAEDLVRGLLRENPNERYTLDQIFTHPWMTQFYDHFDIDLKNKISKSNVGLSQFNNEFPFLVEKSEPKKQGMNGNNLGVPGGNVSGAYGDGYSKGYKSNDLHQKQGAWNKKSDKKIVKKKKNVSYQNRSRLSDLQRSQITSSRVIRRSERVTKTQSLVKKKKDEDTFWGSILTTLGCTVRE